MMKQAAGLLPAVFLALFGCGFGCGGGDGGNANFSKDYAAEIGKDCKETVNCALQRDEQVENDPFNECLKDTSHLLDGDAELQEQFLTNYGRCSQFIVCDYFECATSGASGYGDSQVQRVQYRCQSESDCRAAMGNPDPDPMYAVNSCIAIRKGELDTLIVNQRSAWEEDFLRCSTVTGCEFVNCFAAAMAN
jgi:hypothetical protein